MNKSELTMNRGLNVYNVAGWFFAGIVFGIGLVNTFWGNDTFFGVFIILLSLVFIPPVNTSFKKMSGFAIPAVAKVLLGIFIIWAALGVGELFDKIGLMLTDLQ